jgi:hypothetical protein
MPKFPFGAASQVALTVTGAQAITVDNQLVIIDGVTAIGTGHRTLNLAIDPCVTAGARLVVKTKTNAIENTVFGTGMLGLTYAGVAAKTKHVTFIYDGVNFLQEGTPIQID